jgi:hypothetical protein
VKDPLVIVDRDSGDEQAWPFVGARGEYTGVLPSDVIRRDWPYITPRRIRGTVVLLVDSGNQRVVRRVRLDNGVVVDPSDDPRTFQPIGSTR